jgi:hypothetical protein
MIISTNRTLAAATEIGPLVNGRRTEMEYTNLFAKTEGVDRKVADQVGAVAKARGVQRSRHDMRRTWWLVLFDNSLGAP